MAGHRSAMDTELSSQFFQRAAVLVSGSYTCKFRRRQSTLNRLRWTSRTLAFGGGVEAIEVPKECPGVGV